MNRRALTVLVTVAGALLATAPPLAASAASSGTWTTETPSGVNRREVTYVTVGSKLYLAGGRSPVQQAFDPVAHTWSIVAPLPESLDHILSLIHI